MKPLISRITPAEQIVSRWSGGSTAQIAIEPETAKYIDRDFLWRISSATVEQDKSVFTILPDYNRYLSLLQGSIQVFHGTQAPLTLLPFEIDYFDGGVKTTSVGRCVDFNIMLRKDACDGKLSTVLMHHSGCVLLPAFYPEADTVLVVYCVYGNGTLSLTGDSQSMVFAKNEAVYLRHAGTTVQLAGPAGARYMITQIRDKNHLY